MGMTCTLCVAGTARGARTADGTSRVGFGHTTYPAHPLVHHRVAAAPDGFAHVVQVQPPRVHCAVSVQPAALSQQGTRAGRYEQCTREATSARCGVAG
jgi:hypothetical protein